MNLRNLAAAAFIWVGTSSVASAQFSPGELSLAHQHLSGMKNCLECHDAANEITGKKCLLCHTEIQTSLSAKRGYHFKVSAQTCVACHREHKGKDNLLAAVDKKTFDHNLTGFVRTGKHAVIECGKCHARKNIADPKVLEEIAKTNRYTYRGLAQACARCHEDRHENSVGTNCQDCHSQDRWSPTTAFDHSRTHFALIGKHATVACRECHQGMAASDRTRPLLFTTMDQSDCTPCHTSPHRNRLAARECSSCHTPEDWKTPKAGAVFNHAQAAFTLVGRHVNVPCAKCHNGGSRRLSGRQGGLPFDKCTACHADYHRKEFTSTYNGECDRCHTPAGFVPTTYSFQAHNTSRFPLSGAHLAIACEQCHVKGPDERRHFRFAGVMCGSCHKDRHNGQFASEMKGRSCDACHTTGSWSPRTFDHTRTRFRLMGKHVTAQCRECHDRTNLRGAEVSRYKGTPSVCDACHRDRHGGQFVGSDGRTGCEKCHQPEGWKMLLFDHSRHSAFALVGAHKRVECRACHHEERIGTLTGMRFKPLSMTCESCHARGTTGRG